MQETSFMYLRNFFNNTTKGNFKRMLMLSRDHLDKLRQRANGDATLTNLLQGVEPTYETFVEALASSSNTNLDRQTHTFQLEESFLQLRSLVEDWDIRISFKYRPSTSDYKFLMGMGRTPFSASPYEQRLNMVKDLAERLLRYHDLADVQDDVSKWYKKTNDLRSKQQGLEGNLQSAQGNAEKARVALATKLHWVYSGLMHYYADRLWEVETFYELKYLQRTTIKGNLIETADSQRSEGVIVGVDSRVILLEGAFSEGNSFEFKNTGNANIFVWLSNDTLNEMPSDATLLSPNTTTVVYADELGDGLEPYKFLLAYNAQSVTGKISVSKLS